jgi:cytochrome b subunit of formate dehydrogenase
MVVRLRVSSRTALKVALLVAFGSMVSVAQENEDCLMCHEDESLTGTRNGEEISVYVSRSILEKSAHSDMDCVMCHMDLSGTEFGHDAEVEPVDCSMCHSEAATLQARSVHGRAAAAGDELAPKCTTCHGSHNILPHTNPKATTATMNIPLLCGQCHKEGAPVALNRELPQHNILENYSQSIHGEGLFDLGLTVTAVCTSCHNSHDILGRDDPQSSIHRTNIAETCTACHARIEEVHAQVIEGRLWEEEPHKIPSCSECHSPHEIRRPTHDLTGMSNADCLECHSDQDLTMKGPKGQEISLYVNEKHYNQGAHSGTACAQCHTDVTSSLDRPCATVESRVDCAVCHAEQVNQHAASSHGQLAAAGDEDAPTCLDCHEKHRTQKHTVPTSPTFARNVPDLCSQCHQQGEQAAQRVDSEVPDIIRSYEMSIHGKGVMESGLVVSATCTDCHTAHNQLPTSDPKASTHPNNLTSTCGDCHHGIAQKFKGSIHWPENASLEEGERLPTCEECHTSHEIMRTDKTDFRFMMMDQCGKCHESESHTFFDTAHGKVSRLGSARAAKCYDCHGTHDILPVENPESRLSFRNIVDTCQTCHSGAHRQFAGYLTHATHHDPEKYPYLFWAFWGMTTLLVGTLSVSVVHTGAWLWRLWRTRDVWRAHRAAAAAETQLVQRFTAKQRAMHLVMLLSFFTLALTGMALKFSYMTWAKGLSAALGGPDTMALLHRIGAIALIVLFLYHLTQVYKAKKTSGKTWYEFIFHPDSLMFTMNDLKEFWASIKWFLGFGPRPHYGRFTYWEKFDYFAVFWGVFVIGSTGLILWFPEVFTRVLPGWTVNVATIVHSDEALLAVGFIFTVHFFNTHFRPDKFPMDPVIFTGRVPLEELKHDKPREYEHLRDSGQLEQRMVDPVPKRTERVMRIFGFVALGVGLTLIALIVYTMLFGYR